MRYRCKLSSRVRGVVREEYCGAQPRLPSITEFRRALDVGFSAWAMGLLIHSICIRVEWSEILDSIALAKWRAQASSGGIGWSKCSRNHRNRLSLDDVLGDSWTRVWILGKSREAAKITHTCAFQWID